MKLFNRSILPLILFIISTQFIIASPPDWVDCQECYENTATISSVVLNPLTGDQLGCIPFDHDDDFLTGDICADGSMLAAFDDNGDVRGIAIVLIPFELASSAIFVAGSIPSTLMPCFLKNSKHVPSLEPISITKDDSFKSNMSTAYLE